MHIVAELGEPQTYLGDHHSTPSHMVCKDHTESDELAVDEKGRYILVGTMYNGLYLVGCIP